MKKNLWPVLTTLNFFSQTKTLINRIASFADVAVIMQYWVTFELGYEEFSMKDL